MAEEKCEKILDLKLKYDIALENLQKKPLPISELKPMHLNQL